MSSVDKLNGQLNELSDRPNHQVKQFNQDNLRNLDDQSNQVNPAIAMSNIDHAIDHKLDHKLDRAETAPIMINHLSVRYRSVEALRDINLVIQPGQLTGMIGPNGAGKSTLIKAMLGLIPAWGTASYHDRPLIEQLAQVAYVPQRSQIDWTYPTTVWDVVMMGRVRKTGWFKRFSNVSRRIATEALERVQMLDLPIAGSGSFPADNNNGSFWRDR
jgi:manganese/iron transport system ATP-binding protein